MEKLAAAGVRDVVVNISWLAERFPQVLGDGARWDLRIAYSHEGPVPLETGGGMHRALPLLCGDTGAPFIAINGDIWTDYDLARLPHAPPGVAHLVMVDNPSQHPDGDFALRADGSIASGGTAKLTFAGIGVYRPSLFADWRAVIGAAPGAGAVPPRFKLAPLLRAAMARDAVTGERHHGRWTDVGTPQRLAQLDAELKATPSP
jgi:MurNAc alpha-1-phosphate uridylyltransferase